MAMGTVGAASETIENTTGTGTIPSQYYFGQSFTPTNNVTVTGAELFLAPTGSLDRNVQVQIRSSMNSGVLGTSETTSFTDDWVYDWRTFSFSTPINLTGGTTYYLVISDTNYTLGYFYNGTDVYAGGTRLVGSGGYYNYGAVSGDLRFRIINTITEGGGCGTVTPLDDWPSTPQMTGTTGDPGSVSFNISAGEDRLLVVLGTGQTFSAAYGGQSLTTAHQQNNGGRQTWIGYLNESGITGRSNDTVEVSVNGTHTEVRAYIASYENVDQTSPILNHTGQYSTGATTSLGTLNVNEGGYGIYGWASSAYRESDDESYTEHAESAISNFCYGVASKAFNSTTTTNPVITWQFSNTNSVSFITLNPECDSGNNPPVITSDGGGSTATVHADEYQTAVTTVTATDPDTGDILTYSIIGGADQSEFSIGSSSGVLTFNSAPDYGSPTDANTDGTYEVTVQVTDDDASPLTDTQAISVIVDDVNPPVPTLVSPANGATINTTTPTLDWDPVTGIGDVTYSVRWDDENTFSGGPPTAGVGNNTDYTIPSGLAAGTWYWQVQAYDDSGGSGWSSYWSFTIPSPPTPTLVSPANGATIADTTPTLDWDPVTGIGAVTYSVRWDDESTFSGGPPTAGVGNNTDHTIPSDLAAGAWYWQVQAYDDSGGSGWSSYWSFTISSPPAPTITVSAGFGGWINPTTGTVPYGSNVTYSIRPSHAYIVEDVVVNNVTQGRMNSYTFYNVTSNQTISATFDGCWTEPTLDVDSGVENEGWGYQSDDDYATFNHSSDSVDYYGFGPLVPIGSTVTGIEVSLEGQRESGRTWDIQLSYDGGTSWTPTTPKSGGGSFTGSDSTEIVGGPTDNWGYGFWTDTIVNSDDFVVRLDATSTGGGDFILLDQLQVKVYFDRSPRAYEGHTLSAVPPSLVIENESEFCLGEYDS
jgi:hypothetical protein